MLNFLNTFRTVADPLPPKPATVARKSPHTIGNDAIIMALRQHRKPLSVTELAGAMNCSIGEASKRVTAAKRFLKITKAGRKKMVSLRDLDRQELKALLATVTPGAYWTQGPL